MASLNTFGAILSYAVELEERLAVYYQAAGNSVRAADSASQSKKMARVRQENVVEIALEPIEGLSENDYALKLEDTSAAGQQAVEQIVARFYADVAPKINVREARKALERAGKAHETNAAS